MYEVVLDDEDLAMELFYALQEGEISFPEAYQYIQDKSHVALEDIGDTAPHGAEARDFCCCPAATPDSQTNSDL